MNSGFERDVMFTYREVTESDLRTLDKITPQELRAGPFLVVQRDGMLFKIADLITDPEWCCTNRDLVGRCRMIEMALQQRADYDMHSARKVVDIGVAIVDKVLCWVHLDRQTPELYGTYRGITIVDSVIYAVYDSAAVDPVPTELLLYFSFIIAEKDAYVRAYPCGGRFNFFVGEESDIAFMSTTVGKRLYHIALGVGVPVPDPGLAQAVTIHFSSGDFDFLNLKTYERFEYGVWSDIHHGPAADACIKAAGGMRIVAPGDGSGLIASRTSNSLCTDSVITQATHPNVKKMTISATLKKLKKNDMLVLIYVSAFLTTRDWKIVNSCPNLIVFDRYAPLGCRSLPYAGDGCWSTVKVSCPVSEGKSWDNIPFSENLICLLNPNFLSFRDPYIYYSRLKPTFKNDPAGMKVASTWTEFLENPESYFVTLGCVPLIFEVKKVPANPLLRVVYCVPLSQRYIVEQLKTTYHCAESKVYFAFSHEISRIVRVDLTQTLSVKVVTYTKTMNIVVREDIDPDNGSTLQEIYANIAARHVGVPRAYVEKYLSTANWVRQERGTYYQVT